MATTGGAGSSVSTSLAGEGRPHLRALHAEILQQTLEDNQRRLSVPPETSARHEEQQGARQEKEAAVGGGGEEKIRCLVVPLYYSTYMKIFLLLILNRRILSLRTVDAVPTVVF